MQVSNLLDRLPQGEPSTEGTGEIRLCKTKDVGIKEERTEEDCKLHPSSKYLVMDISFEEYYHEGLP